MTDTKMLFAIEVVYAGPAGADCTVMALQPGLTLRNAIERAGVLARHPGLDLSDTEVGVFGRRRGLDDVLADGDRVEIYRPLQADPKLARRQRVRIARRKTR